MTALALLVVLAITVSTVALFWRLNRTKEELLIEQLLTMLATRTPNAEIVDERSVHGAPIRCLRVTDALLSMIYVWPVEENAWGRPQILSGAFHGTIELGGEKFSYLEFEIAHGRDGKFPHEEQLAYRIGFKKDNAPLGRREGSIGKRTLISSMHVVRFSEIIGAIHDAPHI